MRDSITPQAGQTKPDGQRAATLPQRALRQIEAMTAAQRSSPSITEAAFPYGDLEFGPGPERRLLITMDEAYFNKALPRSAVQYMKVFWRRVPSSPSKEAAFDELLANLDFEALRALFDR